MKKSLFAMALGATLLFACTKPEIELPGEENQNQEENPIPTPGPDPIDQIETNCIHIYNNKGEETASVKLESGAGFTYEGYLLFYATDISGLSVEDYQNGLHEDAAVTIAGLVMPTSIGQEVDLLSTDKRFQFAIRAAGMDIETINSEHNPQILGGTMKISLNQDKTSARFEAHAELSSGKSVKFIVDAPYAAGGEVYNTITFADWPLCLLRTAFYIEREKAGFEPMLIFTPPQFEYADDLPTAIFYAKLDAASRLFDGQYHSISDLRSGGDFSLQVWHGEPGKDEEHWDIVSGDIMMQKNGDYNYSVTVVDGKTGSISGKLPFSMVFTGEAIDGSIHKPLPDNKFTIDKKEDHVIGSVLLDLASEPGTAYIYLCEKTGIKTVNGMLENNPAQIRIDSNYVGGLAGLSTDPLLRITYDGREWSKAAGCEYGSYICDKLDMTARYLSLRIRNFDGFSLDYNGSLTIVK